MERFKFIDYSKGLAILLMLFAHVCSNRGINTWIFSFHMQVFFVICGILLQLKYGDREITGAEFKNIFFHRLRQLGIPYGVFCFALALFYTMLNMMSGQELQVGYYLKRIFCLQGIDSLWFLPCYFLAEILMLATMCRSSLKWSAAALAVLTTAMLSVFPNKIPDAMILRLLVKIMICFVFVWAGRCIQRYRLLEKVPAWTAILMLIGGGVLAQVNGFAAIGSLELGTGYLFFIDAVMTCIAILSLFCVAEKRALFNWSWLSYIGKNTIVILCTNNLLIESIRLLDHKLTGDTLLRFGIAGSILLFLVLFAAEWLLIHAFQGPLGVLMGRKRQAGN